MLAVAAELLEITQIRPKFANFWCFSFGLTYSRPFEGIFFVLGVLIAAKKQCFVPRLLSGGSLEKNMNELRAKVELLCGFRMVGGFRVVYKGFRMVLSCLI